MGAVSFLLVLLLGLLADVVNCASKSRPHNHQGVLQPYSERPLAQHLTSEQSTKLDKGESVMYTERDGQAGYGVVVQDINATNSVCMDRINDLANYNKMVPHVKSVEVYEKERLANGTTRTGAQFNVGVMGLSFSYFMKLRHEPKYNTLTWTLDYRYSSDFDDSVGLWQVMPHPSRSGWTRLLYSCRVKLQPWVPEFVVNSLTKSALTEATSWVKREAEKEQERLCQQGAAAAPAGGGSNSGNSNSGKSGSDMEGTVRGPEQGKGLGRWLPKWLQLKGGSRVEIGAAEITPHANLEKRAIACSTAGTSAGSSGAVAMKGEGLAALRGRQRWMVLPWTRASLTGGRKSC